MLQVKIKVLIILGNCIIPKIMVLPPNEIIKKMKTEKILSVLNNV